MKLKYPHLFSPITIGGVTFENRIWSAPAGTHLLAGLEGVPQRGGYCLLRQQGQGRQRQYYIFRAEHGHLSPQRRRSRP